MKIRIKFSKSGSMSYIGHLDLMRYFQKIFRMVNLPVAFSQGYNPHPLMSFTAPLSVGMTSTGEYLDVKLGYPSEGGKNLNLRDVKVMLDNATNKDISILDIKKINEESKSSMSSLSAADYYLFAKKEYIKLQNFFHNFEEFMTQKEIIITKEGKSGIKKINIAPFIYEAKLYMPASPEHEMAYDTYNDPYPSKKDNMPVIFLRASAGSVFHIKPHWPVMAYYESKEEIFREISFHFHRIEMYADLEEKPKETLEERMMRVKNLISMNEFEVAE